MLRCVEHEKKFYDLGTRPTWVSYLYKTKVGEKDSRTLLQHLMYRN